jgi:hypothetical protein
LHIAGIYREQFLNMISELNEADLGTIRIEREKVQSK